MNRAVLLQSVIEALETRQLLAAVYPTADEQYMVELLNRARANPVAEAQSFNGYNDGRGNTYNGDLNEGLSSEAISSASKQPLAINPFLTDAARTHSQWMVDNDTFSHTGAGGSSIGSREEAAGYSGASTWGENIAANWGYPQPPVPTETVSDQHRSLFTDMSIPGRGHRTNLLSNSFKEVGVGVATGLWPMQGYNYQALATTQDFGTKSTTYLTGVAYADTTSANSFYTPGEGLSGVTVQAVRISDGHTVSTTTWASGGYSLALGAGSYNIQATGGALGSTIYYNNVTVGSENVKRDFVAGHTADPNPGGPAPTPFAKVVSRTLVVTGTSGGDAITLTLKGSKYVASMNGASLSFSTSLVDSMAVKAGAGNDTVVNATAAPAYLEGSDGKDNLTGGPGNDSIYGDGSNDYLDGGAGNDQIVGSGGADVIKGGNGNDRIYGGAGIDNIDAGAGNDRLYGGDGADSLYGNKGNDILAGDAGADYLHGGAHSDTADTDNLDTRVAIEVLS
ncbi:MAG: hypothetical protein H7144_03355 [Burkholderiales bacterium]|nr:hypothetical protein [Phycisphaerae bacterium]